MLENRPRTATVYCTQPSLFLVITQDIYDRLILADKQRELEENTNFLLSLPFFDVRPPRIFASNRTGRINACAENDGTTPTKLYD